MEIKKKCSLLEHKDINSIIYCSECKLYMCSKCENFHSKLFPNHKIFNTDKDIDKIFSEYCQEEEHHHNKLYYFCKSHNQLCCAACIAKIKKKENGKHKDCDVCIIEEIKDSKKSKIKENIKHLEELSNNMQKSIEELKNIFSKISEKKEEIKSKIQKAFTKLRNELNNREDKLMLEVNELFKNNYFNETILKNCENLPNKIKTSLEKVRSIDKEYTNDNNLILFINNCVNIENNINDITVINDEIKKNKDSVNEKISFFTEDEENKLTEKIQKFGKIEKSCFEEIDNPWTSEKFEYDNRFYYTLSENNYVARKAENDSYIHLIKSKYKFIKNKIYKLEFFPEINKKGDFHIGFADYSNSKIREWLKYNSSVGLTNGGLYVDGNNINSKLKIENGKKYSFIIDITRKTFNLLIDEIYSGEYSFNFEDNIYAHAAIRNIGNSIRIKTYEKANII